MQLIHVQELDLTPNKQKNLRILSRVSESHDVGQGLNHPIRLVFLESFL